MDVDALDAACRCSNCSSRPDSPHSNGEARQLIKGGGARLNDAVIGNEMQIVSLADLDAQGQIKLSAGRKRHVLVRPG